MQQIWSAVACACGFFLAWSAFAASTGETVRKTAEAFDTASWQNSQWNTGTGRVSVSDDAAPDCASKTSMKFDAIFSGKGFEGVTMKPATPLVIPGEARTVTLRVKRNDARYGLKMVFLDGWGRGNADGKPLEWAIPVKGVNEWQTYTFQVPADWVKPITIDGVVTHNWEAQGEAKTASFWMGQLDVETDLQQVDPATGVLKTWKPEPKPADLAKAIKEAPKTPLLTVGFDTGVEANVFAGEEPAVTLQIHNWSPGAITGTGNLQVLNDAGKVAWEHQLKLSVESSASHKLLLPMPAFGRYTVKASLELSNGSKYQQELVFAKLPALKQLTDAQKMASPYGLNVHSGNGVIVEPFKKAGLVWFREYAFMYDWVLRAKGTDRRYAGWPYFSKMVQAYDDAGVKVVPVLQQCMKAPTIQDGKAVGRIGPDPVWMQEIATLILAFPTITHWELNNEYDLGPGHAQAEDVVKWANYGMYHKQFGELVSILGCGEKTAVEQGRARNLPEQEKVLINQGYFDKIGVLNAHSYCGTDCPELNYENFNMGFDAASGSFGSLFDDLRSLKQAALSDGKKREAWLTEFGWDTLAGPVVTPYEQAVYLQREWLMGMAAGTDKLFWFYNLDAANPAIFFDGCGLLSAKHEPKLSLCAMAGMSSILPCPHYVGSLNAGDNTWGYVFENEGKLVAALYTLKGDDGPKVSFRAEQLYDYLGNKLEGNAAKLAMGPVYAVGLDKSDLWYRQTAYDLKSRHLMVASGGDIVRPILAINNNRQQQIDCKVTLELPEGWSADNREFAVSVAPGAKQDLEMPFTMSPTESEGIRDAKLVITEGEKVKEVPFRVMVQPALTLHVAAISGRPGPASSVITVANLSGRPQSATLKVTVPSSWKVATPVIEVANLQPKEHRQVKLDVNWTTAWKVGERASVELDAGRGKPLTQPLIPNQYQIVKADKISMDGDLSDWPARAEVPNWMFGSTLGQGNAKVYLAWANQGIYGAVEVHDSKVQNKDPKSFWAQDALEMFIDTHDNKNRRAYGAGDHQFWFVPLVEQNRVYAGQWKRNNEISETLFDLKGIKSAAKKTADGYVMEFLLPASAIQQYQPAVGKKIGVNLNVGVKGSKANREVYWPQPKNTDAPGRPELWGTLELAE